MFIGALVAALVGAVVAIPLLRLGGIFLSLGTLAIALVFETVIVPLGWVSGGAHPVRVPRPVGFVDDRSFLLLCVVILIVVSFFVILVRKGTTGQFLAALRGSETAAQSIGVNPTRIRILAFAVSAGIAGLGGGLLATQKHIATAQDFSYFYGLFLVVLVVTLSTRTVEGAVNAAFSFALALSADPRAARAQPGVGVRAVRPRRDHLRPASRGGARVPEAAVDGRDREAPAGPVPLRAGRRRRPGAGAPGRRCRLMALLDAQRVTKRFSGITALDAVTLGVEANEAVGLIGPNGAGKTTFFNCLLGLLRTDGGSVTFAGRDLARVRRCTSGPGPASGARSSAWSCSVR